MPRRKTLAFGPSTLTALTLALLWIAGPTSILAAPVIDDDPVLGAAHEGPGHGDSGHAEDGHGGVHPAAAEIDILAAEPALAIYTLIVFVLLLALLYRFAWGPLSRALDQREQSIEAAFRDAENARAEAAALLQQHRTQMEQVQDQVRQIMDEANRKAEAVYQERLNQARADAEATADRAFRDISAAKEQAVAELYERSAGLAVTVAGQVLRREIAGDEHQRLIALASEELQSAGANGRGGLA